MAVRDAVSCDTLTLRSDRFVSGSLNETCMPLEVSSAGGPASRGAPSRTAPPRGVSGIMSALDCIMSAVGTTMSVVSSCMRRSWLPGCDLRLSFQPLFTLPESFERLSPNDRLVRSLSRRSAAVRVSGGPALGRGRALGHRVQRHDELAGLERANPLWHTDHTAVLTSGSTGPA